MSLKALAQDFIDWIFFESDSFVKSENRSVMQSLLLKYSKSFYVELAHILSQKIESFTDDVLAHACDFSHKHHHQVMMMLCLMPYCDFQDNHQIALPVWQKQKKCWLKKKFSLRHICLDKFIFTDPKRALLLSPVDEIDEFGDKLPFYLIFMGTHPLPTSPGWHVGVCADANPFLNFGELILKVFKKEIYEVVDLILTVKDSPLICTGHSLGAALALLLFHEKHHQNLDVVALNPPRFMHRPRRPEQHSSQCTIYIQKGDLLGSVGLSWPSWVRVFVLDLDRTRYKIRPFMAHCRCFSALDSCIVTSYEGDPDPGYGSYMRRSILTGCWQIVSLPIFFVHTSIMLTRYCWPFGRKKT